MGKAVEGRWTLKDQVTPAIQRMNKETLKYKAAARSATESISKDWERLKTGALVVSAAFAATAFGIVSFAKSAADEAKDGIEAATKLSAVLHNVKGVTDQQIQGLKDYASAIKDKGVVDDDAQVAGIQQLGTFQLQAASIKTLMGGMADLVAQQKGLNATGEDAVNVGNMVGKAMTGQVGALSRVGISFTAAQEKMLKFGTEQQKAATLAAVLQANVGGVNVALAKTDQGKVKQAANAFSDLKKEIGNTVLLIEGKFAKVFMDKFPKIESAVQSISDRIANWANNGGIDSVIGGMQKVWDAAKSVVGVVSDIYNFFKDNWSLVGPIVYGVAGALVAYKIATFGANVATVLFGNAAARSAIKIAIFSAANLFAAGEIGLMSAAQMVLNAAMDANPIGMVVLAIGALVTVGVLLVKNWQTVKLFLMNTWNVIVGAAQWAVNKYIDYANMMIKVYKFAWDSIKFAGISVWDAVIDYAQGAVQRLLAPINSIRKAFGKEAIQVNFSTAKAVAVKPVWDSNFGIPKVNLGGAKFGDDAIMAQTSKAQAERDKKHAAQTQSMDDIVTTQRELAAALKANTEATDGNTDGTNGLNGTLQKGVAVNMTGEQIADSLVPRLERHLYGTT